MAALETMRLGAWLRSLRDTRGLTLAAVAAGTGPMDQSTLGKIERGDKMPTEAQAGMLAAFFQIPNDEMMARRIAEDFHHRHGEHPAAARAMSIIAEQVAEYPTKKANR